MIEKIEDLNLDPDDLEALQGSVLLDTILIVRVLDPDGTTNLHVFSSEGTTDTFIRRGMLDVAGEMEREDEVWSFEDPDQDA